MNEEKKMYVVPPVDIFETRNSYVLVMDMPGASKEGIEITTDGDILYVTGKCMEADKEWKPVRTEFELRDYRREFTIGNKIDREKINAKYDNGILRLELEKSEIIKPRKIEVKVA